MSHLIVSLVLFPFEDDGLPRRFGEEEGDKDKRNRRGHLESELQVSMLSE